VDDGGDKHNVLDSTVAHHRVTCRPRTGEQDGLSVVVRDITAQQKKHQAETRSMLAELQAAV